MLDSDRPVMIQDIQDFSGLPMNMEKNSRRVKMRSLTHAPRKEAIEPEITQTATRTKNSKNVQIPIGFRNTLSLSQRVMEALFTPVVLRRTSDGSVKVQDAASMLPVSKKSSLLTPRKIPLQYKKFDRTYCVICKRTFQGICPDHPMQLLLDRPVPRDGSVKERARLTAPWPLVVRRSHIRGAGEGVVTTARLPKGLVLGPCEGWVLPRARVSSGYSWKINGRPLVEIDTQDASFSNWTRYLNCPRKPKEQNLKPMQIRGEIFCITTRVIEKNSELLVWYGDDYGSWLSFSPPRDRQGSPNALHNHLKEARVTMGKESPTKKRTRPQASKQNLEPRRHDERSVSVAEMSGGAMKRRSETNPESHHRKAVKVRCPVGFANIVELRQEDTRNKRRGVVLNESAGVPACRKAWIRNAPVGIRPKSAIHGCPMALTGDEVRYRGLADSRLKTTPGTREIFAVSKIRKRESKPRHSSESNVATDTADLRQIIPDRKVNKLVKCQTSARRHCKNPEQYSQHHSKKLFIRRTRSRTRHCITSHPCRIHGPLSNGQYKYECSHCRSLFANSCSLIVHFVNCSEAVLESDC